MFDFVTGSGVGATLPMQYDFALIALSFAVAILAAYTTLEIGGRISASRGRGRAIWIASGAVVLGGGIFSMHFIAMLAMSIGVPVSYDIDLTLASLAIAIAFSAAGLTMVAQSKRGTALVAGGILMGLGISAMHYTGMLALRTNAHIEYDPALFAASIVVALVAATAALWLAFNVREIWKKSFAAMAMAIAITGTHFTGMSAVLFVPSETIVHESVLGIPSSVLAVGVAAAALVILALFVVSLVADRRVASALALEAQRLRDSEERFRRMFDDAEIPMAFWDLSGTITRVNQAMCRYLGYDEEELAGMHARDIVMPDDATSLPDEIEQSRAGHMKNKTVERRYRRKDGQVVWGISNRAVVKDRDNRPVSLISQIQDITDRKQAEMSLVEREKRFRQTFEDSVVPMAVIGLNGKYIRVNRALCEYTGFPRHELLEMSSLDIIHPDEREDAVNEMRGIPRGGLHQNVLERRFMHKDGRTLWGIANRTVLTDHAGNVTSIMSQIQDITVRKAAEQEKEKLEAELRQTQKLQAIGQLAAGIAHEINTPIQFIGDNLQFIQQAFDSIDDVIRAYGELTDAARDQTALRDGVKAVDRIVEKADLDFLMAEIPDATRQSFRGVERVARIVSAMKEFSHPGQREKTPADINRALENTITVCGNEWKHLAEVETDFAPDLPQVRCVVGELNQAFLNLIINAGHAIEKAGRAGNGRIAVSTRSDGNWIEIRVADNGNGIPERDRERIFEPFFTTKEVGKGTGQGLAIVFDIIVNKHGGEIDFKSAEGEGTEFIIRLPTIVVDAGSKAASPRTHASPRWIDRHQGAGRDNDIKTA